ncbi:MAG: hypothetical protein P1V35_04825, partial [Planctomycetota bacterium]|nr:hypothetical protein [Planctomycetota bacterium]
MRKFIVFALLFAAGLYLLLQLDENKKPSTVDPSQAEESHGIDPASGAEERNTQVTESQEGGAVDVDPEPVAQPGDNTPIQGDPDPVPPGDGWTPTYKIPGAVETLTGEAVYGIYGAFSFKAYNGETGIQEYSFRCEHSEPVGNPQDRLYLMINVEFRFQDPVTQEETLVLLADKAR